MQLLLFSGNSIEHKKWIQEVELVFSSDFEKTYVHYYKHWKTKEHNIELGYELTVLGDSHYYEDIEKLKSESIAFLNS